MIETKPLLIRFDKVEGFIRVYGETRYLVLFGGEKYDFIYNRIIYLIGVKSVIAYVISHNYAKIKVDLYDSLPLEKALTFHDIIMLIKSIFNKNKTNYCYNIFLEKVRINHIKIVIIKKFFA